MNPQGHELKNTKITLQAKVSQRECKPNDVVIEQKTMMFESRIWSNRKSYQGGKTSRKKQSRGRTTWIDMLENVLRDIASWRKVEQLCDVSSPCLDDHHFKDEE